MDIGCDDISGTNIPWRDELYKPYWDGVHLVVHPFSIEGLHKVAKLLGIKRCHYHLGKQKNKPHYDVPKYLKCVAEQRAIKVSNRDIVRIIKGEYEV